MYYSFRSAAMWENNERIQIFSEAATSSKERNMESHRSTDIWGEKNDPDSIGTPSSDSLCDCQQRTTFLSPWQCKAAVGTCEKRPVAEFGGPHWGRPLWNASLPGHFHWVQSELCTARIQGREKKMEPKYSYCAILCHWVPPWVSQLVRITSEIEEEPLGVKHDM